MDKNKFDVYTPLNVLILNNINIYYGRKGEFNQLENIENIAQLKAMSYHELKKLIVFDSKIIRIKKALHFYDEQVDRIIASGVDKERLFFTDYKEKYEIAYTDLGYFASYLLKESNDFIFGSFSGNRRKLLLDRLNTGYNNTTYEELANIITNYTTIEELEEDPTKTKVLNRFIKK